MGRTVRNLWFRFYGIILGLLSIIGLAPTESVGALTCSNCQTTNCGAGDNACSGTYRGLRFGCCSVTEGGNGLRKTYLRILGCADTGKYLKGSDFGSVKYGPLHTRRLNNFTINDTDDAPLHATACFTCPKINSTDADGNSIVIQTELPENTTGTMSINKCKIPNSILNSGKAFIVDNTWCMHS